MDTSWRTLCSAFALSLALSASGCGGGDDGGGGAAGSGGSGASSSGGTAGSGASAGAGGAAGGGGSAGSGASAGSGGAAGSGGSAKGGPTVNDFFGLNGFIDDPKDKLAAIGNVREYHNWSVTDGNNAAGYPGYPNNELQFDLWNGFWDFDDYYTSLTSSGLLVFPALQGTVAYLNNAVPPVKAGASTTDAASYQAHASFMYQYAARYGQTKVDAKHLKLASGQTVASGLGLLGYFENGNEPDNDWTHSDGSPLFTPADFAAMTSADYDGHQGAMGSTFGIKNADPNAKLVIAGLAGAGKSDWVTNITGYLDGMRAWVDKNRPGSFPADVINVHYYCFGNSQFSDPNPVPALAPEECDIQGLMKQIVSYRDQYLPGMEIWLTEFGYDTHPKSRLRAPAIGSTPAAVVQGQWLVRSYLELMGSGIDRAFMFMSRETCTGDDSKCPNNHIQFSTCGVLHEKGDFSPKTSFYFLATVRARLGAMAYQGSVDSGNAKVKVIKLYDAAKNEGAYVVWSPTSDGSTVADYQLTLASGIDSAKIVTLKDGSSTGDEAAATIKSGAISVKVTETPALVLVNGTP